MKIAELKTHLSRYVQALRDGGEPIEVCVRERTVAYLTGASHPRQVDAGLPDELAWRIEQSGLRLRRRGRACERLLTPGEPGDGRDVANSVVAMRSEKGW